MSAFYADESGTWQPFAGEGSGGGLSYEVNAGTAYPANVTSFTLPEGLISIGDSAFMGYSSLATITIPDSVTTIGASAFRDCSSLAELTLPAGVSSMTGTYTFRDCSSLMVLTVLAAAPPSVGSTTLSGLPAACSIRVPAGSVAAYKAASYWSNRSAYIVAI